MLPKKQAIRQKLAELKKSSTGHWEQTTKDLAERIGDFVGRGAWNDCSRLRGPEGWLGALADAQIGAALGLMHGNVALRWTVGDLAHKVVMSRTVFAERFKNLVGMTPLKYLTRWRMTVARNALKRHDSNLATIARSLAANPIPLSALLSSEFSVAVREFTGIKMQRSEQQPEATPSSHW